MNDPIRCRLCGSSLTKKLLTLKQMPLTDDFVKAAHLNYQEYLEDIDIYRCSECGIVQNPKNFDHLQYYRDYGYTSGHSAFTRRFMQEYAKSAIEAYCQMHQKSPTSVVEVGSGDGEQLIQFRNQGIQNLAGVEPSETLAKIAEANGVKTFVCGFDPTIREQTSHKYDICISSYTFDHVLDPVGYLRTAHSLLRDGGIIALEVHDLEKILKRCEYCLFEHEHTVYLSADDLTGLLTACGFTVLTVNPIPQEIVRANSLIVLAAKTQDPPSTTRSWNKKPTASGSDEKISDAITATINEIDQWVSSVPSHERLIGFGAGGRGVMTLAAIKSYERFSALMDSNYETGKVLTPKTRRPIVGPDRWNDYSDAHCLVFSYGYFQEIKEQLLSAGFSENRLKSLRDLYTQDPDSP